MLAPNRVSQTKRLTTNSSVKAKEYLNKYRVTILAEAMRVITENRTAQETSSKWPKNHFNLLFLFSSIRSSLGIARIAEVTSIRAPPQSQLTLL